MSLGAIIESYGVSPWELEVARGYLGSAFSMEEAKATPPSDDVTSYMRIGLPVVFSDAFFEWFGFRRWEKIVLLLKEMKRRRKSHADSLIVRLDFEADPKVSFLIRSEGHAAFASSVEKLDYALESLERHLGASGEGPLVYRFDPRTRRWEP